MSKSVNKPTSFGDDQVFDPNSTPSNIEYPINQPEKNPVLIESPVIPVVITQTAISAIGITGPIKLVGPRGAEPIPVEQTKSVLPICQIYEPTDVNPWPTIIISVLGAIVIIYTAVAPNVDENRRVFGVVFLLLWTLIWAILLWVLWRECHRSASWWLLLIPVIAMALFFVLIIVMNVGSSI